MFRLCVASVQEKGRVEILYVLLYPQDESGSTVLERIVYYIVSVLSPVNWRTPSQQENIIITIKSSNYIIHYEIGLRDYVHFTIIICDPICKIQHN